MKIELKGVEQLTQALIEKSKTDWSKVGNDSISDMFNRASSMTPIDTGELRLSRVTSMIITGKSYTGLFGYNKDYAPHVEYGRRTRGGGYVEGQYYLKNNVEIQRPIYKSRLIEELRK